MNTLAKPPLRESILADLSEAQNPDGGWGAKSRKLSNTEATAYALLALASLDAVDSKSVNAALHWLSSTQRVDGSWRLSTRFSESSWTSAIATTVLCNFESGRSQAIRGANWLVNQEGRGIGLLASLLHWLAPDSAAVKLNPFIKGWSWTPETFSWVEPTAYSLIALKKLRPHLEKTKINERIEEGERLIYDRMCQGGGWNYGNSNVLGESLWPYPDVTAVALIALQDQAKREENQMSLRALRKMMDQTDSGLALSWSIICLNLYGEDTKRLRDRLERRYRETGFLGETKSIALALLALGKGAEVFRF
jgi:hypothetical protein